MTTDLYKQITYHLERHDLSLKKIAQICGVDPHTVKAIDKDRLSKLYTTEDGSHRKLKYHLERHDLSLKKIAQICGVDPHTVKAIDKDRLSKLYTTEDGSHRKLKKPIEYSRYLGIDEFKLHNHHQYATHIIDLDTGHILWIAFGKKKQIVYDFINHVGYNWMRHVKAVSCDMNAYFYSAFHEKCPWIQVVYDRFHLIKNFNDKVISMVRKDEQRRLIEEGNLCKARSLKQTRYILLSSPETLERKDALASQGTKTNPIYSSILSRIT